VSMNHGKPYSALDTRAALGEFFASCDRVESGDETDWEVQRLAIEQSRTSGLPSTREGQ
jgi:hypothetical protein